MNNFNKSFIQFQKLIKHVIILTVQIHAQITLL